MAVGGQSAVLVTRRRTGFSGWVNLQVSDSAIRPPLCAAYATPLLTSREPEILYLMLHTALQLFDG